MCGLVDGGRYKVAHGAPLQPRSAFDQRVQISAGAYLKADGGRSWRGFGGAGHGIDRIDKDCSAVCFSKIQQICYI